MPTFYPSCVVNVRLKFDEALQLQPAVRPQTTQETIEDPPQQSGQPAVEPLITRRGDQNVSYIYGRVPRGATIELPGYRQAGQFSAEFDFRDVPIDPRTVRAASVEMHTGAIPDDEFGIGVTQRESSGRRVSVLNTQNSAGQSNATTLRMVGLVDEWSVEHNDSGSTISMRGRDLRGILLDTPIEVAPGATTQLLGELDYGQPINQVVQQILNFGPLFQEITVRVNPAEWPNGEVTSPGTTGVVPRNRRGARGRRSGGRPTPPSGGNNLNFWDMIVRSCYLAGAIPYFIGRDLYIRPSRSIFDQLRAGFDPRIPTPFRGGQPRGQDRQANVAIDPPLTVRRMVYGRDVESISFDRKYGGFQRPRVVRCVSVDASSRERGSARIVEGRWPPAQAPEPARRTRVAPGGQAAHEEILNVPVSGIRDAQRLEQIARSVYEEIGRGEMGGSCTTRNLASFGGDNVDPDLLRMGPGDGIEFLVDVRNLGSAPPLVSTYTDSQRQSFEEAVQDIQRRLGDENLARVIVATSRGQVQELQRFFRVSTVRYNWSASEGMKIDFDFQNYVVSRNQLAADTDDRSAGEVESVTSRTQTQISSRSPLSVTRGRPSTRSTRGTRGPGGTST